MSLPDRIVAVLRAASTLRAALKNKYIAPKADPNTAAHIQRLMRMVALRQIVQETPQLYDRRRVDLMCLRALGIEDPEYLMTQLPAQQPTNPLLEATAKAKIMDALTRQRAQAFKEQSATIDHAQRAADRELDRDKQRANILMQMVKSDPTFAAQLDQIMTAGQVAELIPQHATTGTPNAPV